MKKKLFVFVVLSMVVLFSACKPAVKGGDTSNSEIPLELTAANLTGRWAREGNSSVWFEFARDLTCKNSDNETGTYSIIDNKTVKGIWKDVLNIVTVRKHNIAIYKNYIVLNNKKYIKSN